MWKFFADFFRGDRCSKHGWIAQFIGAEDTKEAWCSFDVSIISGIVIAALQGACHNTIFGELLGSRCKHRS